MKPPRNFVFMHAEDGKVLETYNAVVNNDPTGAAFVLVLLAYGSVVNPSARSLAEVLNGGGDEARGWERRRLTSEDLGPFPEDASTLSLPSQTWREVSPKADRLGGAIICYDSDVLDLLPLTYHSVDIAPDWSDVTFELQDFWHAGLWAMLGST